MTTDTGEDDFDALEDAPVIETPREAIFNARGLFVFAMHLREAIAEARPPRITPNVLVRELTLDTGDGRGFKILKAYTADELDTLSLNLVYNALGTAAIAVDAALATLGPRNADDASELGSLRAIFYMLRNAFAHDPFHPVWKCDQRYRRTYKVAAAGVAFDGAAADGHGVMPNDVGGVGGIFKLLEIAADAVA